VIQSNQRGNPALLTVIIVVRVSGEASLPPLISSPIAVPISRIRILVSITVLVVVLGGRGAWIPLAGIFVNGCAPPDWI
jgi:hypothetical protein